MACAGNFEFDKLIDMLNHSFGSLRRGSEPEKGKAPVFNNKVTVHNKELSRGSYLYRG